MSGSKYFDRIAVTITALTLLLTFLFLYGAELGLQVASRSLGYESRLFNQSRLHTVDIVMDDWDAFIETATDEEYSPATVVIDGEAYKNVGIRAKGNTSLSNVASMGSQRYSFKIEFDHYDSSKSYYGLDKLCLNNLIQDSTMMKDYLTYSLMNAFGVNASLCSYVYITVNGEDWGLYLAVEGVEDAFLQRNYGSDHGELYKPDSSSIGGGRGNGKDFRMEDFEGIKDFDEIKDFGGDFSKAQTDSFAADREIAQARDEKWQKPEQQEQGGFGGFGGFGMGSSDVKLQYIDDSLDSYSNIWDNAKTNISESDQNRLIQSLKQLSDKENIESVVDVEQVLRYFVVHNYVCNGDSYTGSMVHNYYLYEKDGKLAMLPWDYNLAFGTFSGGSANSSVNTPIDSPVSGGTGEDRPLWYWIVANEEETSKYHQYFAEFLSSVDIQAIIDDAYELIQDAVAKDPTAFYSVEEFEQGVETLRQFCRLRSESITLQLENGETVDEMNYVDASTLNLSDMGSMGDAMGHGGMNMDMDMNMAADREQPWQDDGVPTDREQPPQPPDGAEQKPQLPPDGQGEAMGMLGTMGTMDNMESMESMESTESTKPDEARGDMPLNRYEDRQPPQDAAVGLTPGGSPMASRLSEGLWLAASLLILLLGLAFAKGYRR